MRKFSLLMLLAALFTCLAVSAQDYYLVGGFNDWQVADPSCKFTAQADGTYVLNYAGSLTSGFKVNDGTWDNPDTNIGSNGEKLVVGVPYLYGTGNIAANIDIEGDLAVSNPKVTLDTASGTLLVEGSTSSVTVTYAIHGCLTSDSWEDTQLNNSGSAWTANVTVTNAAAEFGIRKMANGVQEAWYASEEVVSVGGPVELALVPYLGTYNIKIAPGSYSFSFNPDTLILSINGSGNGNGNDNPNPPAPGTTVFWADLMGIESWDSYALENGSYTFTVSDTPVYFTFTDDAMNAWPNAWRPAGNTDQLLSENGTVTAVAGSATGDGVFYITAAGTYTVTVVNAAAYTFKISGFGGNSNNDDPNPPAPGTTVFWADLYGLGDWDSAELNNGSYTFTVADTPVYFTFTDDAMNAWPNAWRPAGNTDQLLSENGTVTAVAGSATGDGVFYITAAGTYTVTVVNAAAYTFKISGFSGNGNNDDPNPPTPDDDKFGVVGSMQDWSITAPIEMKSEGNNVYTISFDALAAGTEFKIAKCTGSWNDTFGAEGELGATTAAPVAVVLGENMNAWKGSSNNFLISEDLKNVVITFTYNEDETVASSVKVTGEGSGVSTIASEATEAVYYNLNGMRVDNVSNGIFIVREGNNTRKVVIR